VAPERDEQTGKFNEKYPDEAFLQAVESLSPATTSKVAENIGCSYDLAYRRLNTLADRGSVARQEVGGSFVWTEEEQ